MAEPQGILAILAGKKKPGEGDDGSEDDSEPTSRKARAVRDMFKAAGEEDWDKAAEMFERAYVECKMGAEKEDEGREDDEDASEDVGDYGE